MTTTLLGPLSDSTITAVSWTANVLTVVCILPLCWATWRHYDEPPARPPEPGHVGYLVPGRHGVGMVATVGLALGGAPTSAWTIKLALSVGPAIIAVDYAGRKRSDTQAVPHLA